MAFVITSCTPARLLKENEKILYKQNFEGNKSFSEGDLEPLLIQKPNRRIPLIGFPPYIWFYQVGESWYNNEKAERKHERKMEKLNKKLQKENISRRKIARLEDKKLKEQTRYEQKTEEGNLLMRIGEKVVVYDSMDTKTSTDKIQQFYLANGFFNNQVDFSTKKRLWRVNVNYQIEEGTPYILDTLQLIANDSTIYKILQNDETNSLLQKGDNYQQDNITKERDRIANTLKNNGYYGFSPQYITFQVDTTYQDHKVAVRTLINPPGENRKHKQFSIDSIIFITDSDIRGRGALREFNEYGGITYGYFKPQYRKKLLTQRVFMDKDSLYSRESTLNTQKQLANMDIFKFVNINYDTAGGIFVANIFASPLKKFQTTNEVGVTVAQGFPGPFYNLTFKNRNPFGGLEILQINGRAGIEGVASATDPGNVYQSSEIRGNLSLTFPQFILPINEDLKRKLGQINPRTTVQSGFSFSNRPEYNRSTTNFNFSYNWQNQKNTQFSFTPIDLSLINSEFKDEEFRQQLQRSGNLINAFNPSFVTKTSGSVTFNFNSYGLYDEKSAYLRLTAQSGGTWLSLTGTDFFERQNLEYFQYLKFAFDFRRFLPLPYENIFAYRIRAGVALPYGTNNILPYEEYFFAGGSNGIRAWQPRRLGPGSYTENEPNGITRIEQPGEIVLESSLEWRRKLVGFLDGAYFIDFGNVWSIRDDDSREGSQFEINDFFTEIAVGTGVGVRFDFTFLIIRFDVAVKVLDPAQPMGSRFVLDDFTLQRGSNYSPLINIGIGYPF